jgi:predicted RNase H-like nuclease (RuvC/YqgF family)
MSSQPPQPGAANSDEVDFEQSLREAEQSLLLLKARYAQIQSDQQQQQVLRQRLSETQRQMRRDRSQTLKTELKQIQQQLEGLEVALESQLFSWSGLKEVFWQAVRFGGLGVLLGWLLKSLVG